MANKGTLYLIPSIIAENTHDQIATPQLKTILPEIKHFLAENIRTARRYLSSLKVYDSIEPLQFAVLDKSTSAQELKTLITPLHEGHNMGVISESGCPGIADPGSLAVHYAHEHGFKVIPLVGPSSIILALMGSGLNGQKFAFHGYLPIDGAELSSAVKSYEKESKLRKQTQIFIETPYRNNSVFHGLIKHLSSETLLTIALDLTGTSEMIQTRQVSAWRNQELVLPKSPAVFLFLA